MSEEKYERPFENNSAEETEKRPRKVRKAPFEPIVDLEKVKEYVFPEDVLEFAHGNIFDQNFGVDEERRIKLKRLHIKLKRLQDEGY